MRPSGLLPSNYVRATGANIYRARRRETEMNIASKLNTSPLTTSNTTQTNVSRR